MSLINFKTSSLLRQAPVHLINSDRKELDKPIKALLHIACWLGSAKKYVPVIKKGELYLRLGKKN